MKINKITILSVLLLLWIACKKEEPTEKFGYGFLKASLLPLPGVATLDIYINDKKLDSLTTATEIGNSTKVILPADKPTTISFKKKGTDLLVIDTVLQIRSGATASLTVAYSSVLGISAFSNGATATISPDSTAFFLFNALPDFVQPDDMIIDAYLVKLNPENGMLEETGDRWIGLERGKFDPKLVTLKYLGSNGNPETYGIQIKNHATAEVLVDPIGSNTFTLNGLVRGQRGFLSLNIIDFGGGFYMYQPDYAAF